MWAFLRLLVGLAIWNVAPNGKRAVFSDIWSGHRTRTGTFRPHLRDDLASVLAHLASGAVVPQIAARLPLTEVAEAVRVAEARTEVGKVVLHGPDADPARASGDRRGRSATG